MEISIDILLVSKSDWNLQGLSSQMLRVVNLPKKEQFSLKRFTSGKSMVF